MRAKRSFILLGPGIVASLAFSPGIAAAASAAAVPAQAVVAAPSAPGLTRQAAPPDPYPSGYDSGYEAGKAAGEAGEGRRAIPIPPTAHTHDQMDYYRGFVAGYSENLSLEQFAVAHSTAAAAEEFMQQQEEANRYRGITIAPLPKDQPMLPGSTTPTQQTGQGTAPQGQDSGLQGPTVPVTPTHETGQGTAPQGQDTGAQHDTTFEDQGFGSEGGFYGE
ncbi:hypothetical protein [Streptomyces sp. NPDC057696]|uniref:hypothetical protein n=1 Tax=Streptomyces sp. NPDC057696 TaxID=3346218 RepID=UPI003690379A